MSDQKIRIAIDGNEANVSQRVGSNTYAFEILNSLEKITRNPINDKNIDVVVLLNTPAVTSMPTKRIGWSYRVFGPKPWWTQWALPLYLFRHAREFDVFFTPGHYAPRWSSVKYVSSVMDLAFLGYPRQFLRKDLLQLTEWTRYSIQHAHSIVAISEHTKHDVVKYYQRAPKDVVVAYPAINRPPKLKDRDKVAILKKLHIAHPYFLYVGTLQPRKNLERLVEAFEQIIDEHLEEQEQPKHANFSSKIRGYNIEEVKLVIAGKKGWLSDEIIERITASLHHDRIILTGYITDQEKHALYSDALATVLVGLYEGFGMPPLEAIAAGSIPIVSNTTSLPEVVGEAGVFVSPTSVKSIADGLRQVLTLPSKTRAQLLKKGRNQLKKFSWDESANIVLETLLNVATKKRKS